MQVKSGVREQRTIILTTNEAQSMADHDAVLKSMIGKVDAGNLQTSKNKQRPVPVQNNVQDNQIFTLTYLNLVLTSKYERRSS